MSDTRTQGADGNPLAKGPAAEAPRAESASASPTSVAGSSTLETTSVRPPWRTKLRGKVAGAVEEHRDSAQAPAGPPTATVATPPTASAAAPAASRAAARPAPRKPRGPRKARLRLTRVDPWSVMKTSFLLSIALAVVIIVSVTIVWSVLGAAGVWDSVNSSVQQVVGGQDTNNFDIEDYVGLSRVLGFTMLISVLDVVLITAVSTLSAFLYNLSAALLGGIEVTLAEDGR